MKAAKSQSKTKVGAKDALAVLDRKKFIAAVVILMFVLPAVISFGLSYCLDYISGDIMAETLYDVLDIVNTVLTYILPFFTIALCMCYMIYFGGIKRVGGVALSVLSLIIPYASSVITGVLLISELRSNVMYYSLLFGVNCLLFRLLPLFLALVAAGLCITHDEGAYENTLTRVLRWAIIFFAAADLGYEIYLTISFVIELTTEYFRAPTVSEIISLVLGYVIAAAKNVLGYYLMLLTVKFVRKKEAEANPSQQ